MILHQCFKQEMIAIGKAEPTGKRIRCRCRQRIESEEAERLLKEGRAKWIVLKRIYKEIDVPCQLCHGAAKIDVSWKSCANCKGLGTQKHKEPYETLGNDIVAVSVIRDKEKYRPAIAKKTPRVATIERAHIERSYVNQIEEERIRIEEYGRMILEARAKMIVPEPEDDPKTGTGRRYDYGRAIIIK
jgi:RecJ-like exonuclease